MKLIKSNESLTCQECIEFDKVTAAHLQAVHSQDHLALQAITFLHNIHGRMVTMKGISPNDGRPETLRKKMLVQRDIDFTSHMVAHILVAIDEKTMKVIGDALKKQDIYFNVKQAPCPHKQGGAA